MLKVLVVDDEAPIRQWLEYCVDQFDGFTVAGAAASGVQGLDIYRRELPDIVVSDIEMPGMDGLEMLRRMQKIHSAYMIILTSHEDFSYARQALTQGTAEYILKAEITMSSFQEALNKAAGEIRSKGISGDGDIELSARRLLGQLASEAVTESLQSRCCAGRELYWKTSRFWWRISGAGRGPNCPSCAVWQWRRRGLTICVCFPRDMTSFW